MKIQPRQQLLEIWQATARASFRDGKWTWGGRDGSNAISDAEQLLCLLVPATQLPSFVLERPDETPEDVLEALRVLGDSIEIPRLIIRVLTEYMQRYTDETGTPVFAGDSYFTPRGPAGEPVYQEPTDAQRALDVVEAFSAALTLSLAALSFVRVFRSVVRRESLLRELDVLEDMASTRLTATMIGLLRSYAVNIFDPDSPAGQALCHTANQSGLPARRVAEELQRALRDVRAGLRDLTVGSLPSIDLDNQNRLFECGWSWGIVQDAPVVDTTERVGRQPDGFAVAAPDLYFTAIALEGIEELWSERTRLLALLNEEQQRLAQALQLRWDLTRKYWSTIATFGAGRWPVEDIPWQTTDGKESDYFSLLVTTMVLDDLLSWRASDTDRNRLGQVLVELANRGKITRRPIADDPAIELHVPGVWIELVGSEKCGARLGWTAPDFAPLLLRRTLRVASTVQDIELRSYLLALADGVWEHLRMRGLRHGPARDLWDQPAQVFAEVTVHHELPSWYYTERVVECLVAAAHVINRPPLRSGRLADYATDLLNEADHLFDQELLNGSVQAGPAMRSALQGVRANLSRARELMPDRPAIAAVLASEVLRDLDRLAAARQDASGAS